jgi:hypothetical protein
VTRRQFSISRIVCCLTAALFGSSSPSVAQQYPLVLTYGPLREVGISAENYIGRTDQTLDSAASSSSPLPYSCYYYGDGGYDISLSSSFLARFTSRGFSRQSACLGLVSESKYNPETGQRLPTYIIVNPAYLKGKPNPHDTFFNVSPHEHPLDLPNCFRNGNPYTDCQFRFGRLTGKKLTEQETNIYHKLGEVYDSLAPNFLSKLKTKDGDDFFDVKDGKIVEEDGWLLRAGWCPFTVVDCDKFDSENGIDEFLLRYSSATFWARSTSFPRGYGYALDAEGGAGEDADPASVKAALLELARHKITAEELTRVLAERH